MRVSKHLIFLVVDLVLIVMEQEGTMAEHLVDGTPTVASISAAAAAVVIRVEFSGHALVEALVDAVEEIRPHLCVGRDHRRTSTSTSTIRHYRRRLQSRSRWSRTGIMFLLWNAYRSALGLTTATTATDRELVQELVHGRIGFQQGTRSPKGPCRKLSEMGQPHHRVAVAAHGGEDPALEEVEVLVRQLAGPTRRYCCCRCSCYS